MIPTTAILEAHLTNLSDVQDYIEVLQSWDLEAVPADAYLTVGRPQQTKGWIIHLSVVVSQLPDLLNTVAPSLAKAGVPFKIPLNKQTALVIMDGHLGYEQVGKMVTLYPSSDAQAQELASWLISATKQYQGPAIPTDAHLGSVVYTRFGAYQPIILMQPSGAPDRYYQDKDGKLVRDSYTIPFQVPAGVSWPFNQISPPRGMRPKKILDARCKPLSIIKADARGNVTKGIYLKGLFRVKDCIIKEGRHDMTSDESGRDIKDRLAWQDRLHRELAQVIPLPQIYNFFEDGGDAYLVMEFVKGASLFDLFQKIRSNARSWLDLSAKEKRLFLFHIGELVHHINKMHEAGYVHRDITPVNFLIREDRSMVLIDIELAYSLRNRFPSPPFGFGTPGFVSPEQAASQEPTVQEDVYGLCATLILLLTNLSPMKFDRSNPSILEAQLEFFIQHKPIARLIASGLSGDPKKRPTLSSIQSALKDYDANLEGLNGTPNLPSAIHTPEPSALNEAIQGAIFSLVHSPTVVKDGIWASKTIHGPSVIVNQRKTYAVYPGLYEGLAGVLYALSRSTIAGFQLGYCIDSYHRAWRHIDQELRRYRDPFPGGLHRGSGGIALSLAAGIRAGLMERIPRTDHFLETCLRGPVRGCDLASGASGQGLAILQCSDLLAGDLVHTLLAPHLSLILQSQEKDGSWLTASNIPRQKGKSYTGLSFGVAGITWFLLEYLRQYPEERVRCAAESSMEWLCHSTKGLKTLFDGNNQDTIAPADRASEDAGHQGIIALFIKAYEVLNNPEYQQMAEEALQQYPRYGLNNDTAVCSGLAGLGEVLLDAYRVFGNPSWLERAGWIAQTLLQTRVQVASQGCIWVISDPGVVTADLMTGTSGILHFLLRFNRCGQIGYRLLT